MESLQRNRRLSFSVVLLLLLLAGLAMWLREGPADQAKDLRDAPRSDVRAIATQSGPTAGSQDRQSVLDPTSTHTDATLLSVRVVDPEHRPVSSASVWRDGDSASTVSRTDDTGCVRLYLEVDRTNILVVTAQGRRTTTAQVPPTFRGELTIVLEASGIVEGSVIWTDSSRCGQGYFVAAWPDGYSPTREQLGDALSGRPSDRLFLATTDDRGSFTVDGAGNDTALTLVAGGYGGITLDEISACQTIGPPVQLTLSPVYAAVVRVREVDGSPLRISDGIYGRGASWTYYASDSLKVEPVLGVPIAFFLAAPRSDWSLSATSVVDQLLLASAEQRVSGLNQIEYDVDVPGYLPGYCQLDAAPLGHGALEHRINLRSLGMPTGQLEIRCSGFSSGIKPDSLTERRMGILTLADANGNKVTVVVDKPCLESTVYSGIPFGSYRAMFRRNDWPYAASGEQASSASIDIGPVPAVYTIDLRGLGSVRPRVVDTGGSRYSGAVHFRLYNNDGTRFLTFGAEPYVIDGVPPGRYWLAIDRLPGIDRQRQIDTVFEVAPDEVVQPVLELVR